MSDNFLQLFKNDFCSAKTVNRIGFENIIHTTNIVQFPNETFLQVTDLKEDIAFAGNIQVDLINDFEAVVRNLVIDLDFSYTEFTDYNGIKQIAYEFGNFNEDFYNQNLYLKITHTFSQDVWYSNAFNVSFYQGLKTTRLDYGNEDSETFYLKSIRLRAYLNDINSKSETKEYTQLSGNVISERKIITKVHNYKMYCCNFFDFETLDNLLANDIIYINGTRISNKPQLKKGERLGDSNFFDLDFETNPTDEVLDFQYFIYKPLELISTTLPSGSYTLTGFNSASSSGQIILLFNKNIEIMHNFALLVYKDGILNQTVTTATVVDKTITVDINIAAIGVYDIIIKENLIYSGAEFFSGLKLNDLKYTIVEAQFDGAQFDGTQFLTDI